MDCCHDCGREVVEIDNRGEHLTGCLTCNLWATEEGKRWVRLSVEDLRALHQLRHGGTNRAPTEADAPLSVPIATDGPKCRKRCSKSKRSGIDAGRPELKRCLEYLREGDTLLVTKIDRLARSTSDLYRIVSQLAEKGVSFKVIDDPSIDTSSRTGKLVMGILALIAEFENDIRRARQMDGIKEGARARNPLWAQASSNP